MGQALISILIPTRNRRDMLHEALTSAFAQTHENVRVLVSDDGSTDGTKEYLANLAGREPRLRIAPQNPTPGLFSNFNHLLSHREGEAFCFLGDDDRLLPTFVEGLFSLLNKWPKASAAFSGYAWLSADGSRTLEQPKQFEDGPAGLIEEPLPYLLDSSFNAGCGLYRSSAVTSDGFDLACGGTADIDFNIRTLSSGPFVCSREALVELRIHAQAASRSRYDFMTRGLIHTLEKHRFDHRLSEQRRLDMLQQSRVGFAAASSKYDPTVSWQTISSYLREPLRSWSPRQLASLARSTLRIVRARILEQREGQH